MPDSHSTAPGFDESDLAALDEAIAQVLASEADHLVLHRHIDGETRLDNALWERAAELGWPAIGLPEDSGGLGFGSRGLDLLHRRLGRHVAPGPFLATLSAAQTIAEVADAGIASQWLPRLAAGECRLAVVAQIAPHDDNQAWIIGDQDCEAVLTPLANDNWGLVPIEGARPADMWDRTRAMLTLDLSSPRPIIELPGEATAHSLERQMNLALASESIGAARAILEITVEYMKEREQFGRPIASFQALKHRIADHMTEIVSGEEFVGLAVESGARSDPDACIWAKLAKVRCTESHARIAQDCLQLHGGVGFTWEFDVHIYLNRARLNELLVAPNTQLRDEAAAGLAESIRAGREPLELA